MRTGYTSDVTGTDKGANVQAVSYVRVSSEEQRRHGYSLDDQERELRVRIGLRDWELVKVVRAAGISGAAPNRPGLRRIEELVGEGRCDVALATKRNRWFRETARERRRAGGHGPGRARSRSPRRPSSAASSAWPQGARA